MMVVAMRLLLCLLGARMVLVMAHTKSAASPRARAVCGIYAVDHAILIRVALTEGHQHVISQVLYRPMAVDRSVQASRPLRRGE
jgi:hypothetical protein